MMAFIDDDLPVTIEQFRQIFPARQGLHDGDVDLAGRFLLATTNAPECVFGNLKETGQTFLPLPQQFGAVDQHQRAHLASSDQGGSGDGLAESGGSTQHTDLML